MSYIKYIIGYYLFENILLFILMAIDKFKAVHSQWRIKENTLFSISLLGGCIGGFLGMSVFHHKTKKPKFYIVYTISLIIHIALIYFLLYVMGGDIV